MARSGPPPPAPRLEHPGIRMAAVVAGFHRELGERLLHGAQLRLAEAGLPAGHLEDHWVPGAFELPLAAKSLAMHRRYAAIIALGVVIRGETAHFDHICNAAASGLTAVGLETGVPVRLRRAHLRDPGAGRGPLGRRQGERRLRRRGRGDRDDQHARGRPLTHAAPGGQPALRTFPALRQRVHT